MATTPQMSLILPTLGGDRGAWDDKVNAALLRIDGHSHIPGLGTQVPTAGLLINADLSFGGFGATALGKAAFSVVTPLATGARTLFVSNVDGELYWRTNAGVNVKLTSGASLNLTLVGGIVGDYAAVGAEVAFDDANKRYTFKDGTAGTKRWARLASGPLRLYEYNTSEAVYVELAVATALGANYTLTLPAAVAAGFMLVDGSGVVSFSYTLPTDQNITLQGLAKLNHGEKYFTVALKSMYTSTGGGVGTISFSTDGNANTTAVFNSADGIGFVDLPEIKPGDRIKRIIMCYTATTDPAVVNARYVSWTNHASFSITAGSVITDAGKKYREYVVDVPTALGIYDPSAAPTVPAFAQRAVLTINSDSTDLNVFAVTVIYDSVDVLTVTT